MRQEPKDEVFDRDWLSRPEDKQEKATQTVL